MWSQFVRRWLSNCSTKISSIWCKQTPLNTIQRSRNLQISCQPWPKSFMVLVPDRIRASWLRDPHWPIHSDREPIRWPPSRRTCGSSWPTRSSSSIPCTLRRLILDFVFFKMNAKKLNLKYFRNRSDLFLQKSVLKTPIQNNDHTYFLKKLKCFNLFCAKLCSFHRID